jgi:hypothetical protein
MRRLAPLVLALVACAAPREPRAASLHLVGVVRRAPPRVLLETGDGRTWVASETQDPLLESFDGRRVDVVGEAEAPHLKVKALRLLATDPYAPNVAVGAEVELTGYFEEWTWPAGTKLAGEKALRFVTVDGHALFVAPLPTEPPMGEPVTVRGRMVTPSPFLGGVSGERFWVYDVRARD